jgi:hypothetical protein
MTTTGQHPTAPPVWAILEELRGFRETPPGSNHSKASCPAHDDRTPSLSIGIDDDGRVLLHCFGGCSQEAVRAALGADWRDYFPMGAPTGEKRYTTFDTSGKPHAHRRYYDENGETQRPWTQSGVKTAQMRLYGSERLKDAPAGSTVYICEGEPATEALWKRGVLAVGTVCGAGVTPHDDALRDLRKFTVILWPDHDDEGREHMRKIAARFTVLGVEVAGVISDPTTPPKGDAVDYFAHGGTVEGLESLLCESANCEESEESPRNGDNSHNSQFADSHEHAREDQDTPPTPKRTPPTAMGEDAYHGLVGEIVNAITPHTEADPAGVLVQLLALFGALVGRSTYFQVSGTRHYPILFANLVGDTAKARKGMSWGVVRYVFNLMGGGVADWLATNVIGGLSSGEGLIHALADYDASPPDDGKKRHDPYPTQTDKRALVYESEFASVLKMPARDGNTLSEVLRRAWDGDTLQTLTKSSPERATGAHIAIVGNITCEEVRRHLSETDRANGLGNRFLWVYVRRARLLPDGGDLTEVKELKTLATRLQQALDTARKHGGHHVMTRDTTARALWHKEYARLSEGYPDTMFGAMTARSEAQVMRLACIYALLGCSDVVRVEHLQAALAVWTYCEDSVRFVFGDVLGDPVADTILRALRTHPDGMTRTEIIADVFARHIKAEKRRLGG